MFFIQISCLSRKLFQMIHIRRYHNKRPSCGAKLSTLTGQLPRSANNSIHHYHSPCATATQNSSMMKGARKIMGARRSMDNLRKTYAGKENKTPRGSANRTKGPGEYEMLMEIGEGAFGKVWKVRQKESRNIYALKAMLKGKILGKKSVNAVMNEKTLLAKVQNSKFVVNAVQAFQDRDYLYLLMDYMPGGDLRYIIYAKSKCFTEEEAKFLICCLVTAVRALHKLAIIHRDIKPENLVMDGKGYLRLTDMGISKIVSAHSRCDGSGTPAYMSPQSFESGSESFLNDYYAIGVIAFELLNGRRPYVSKTREEIYDEMHGQKLLEFEDRVSPWGKTFCQGLLHADPNRRLGSKKGIAELQGHEWLQGVDWTAFRKKKYRSPFGEPHDESDLRQYQMLLEPNNDGQSRFNMKSEFQFLFKDYDHNF